METKTAKPTLEMKKEILAELLREKQLQFDEFKEAQEQKLESSNSEDVTDDDRFERKREQMMDEIGMRAPVLDKIQKDILTLKAMQVSGENHSVQKGALVRTNKGLFFISIAHPERLNHDHSWMAISEEAPIYLAMKGKKTGDAFDWKGEPYLIKAVI